jgi:hypothetical protein
MPVFDVICRSCRGVYHETNERDGWIESGNGEKIRNPFVSKFDPKAIANASMFRLKEPFVSYGWTDFPKDPSLTGDSLECPECGAPYPDGAGRVLIRKQESKRDSRAIGPEDLADVV